MPFHMLKMGPVCTLDLWPALPLPYQPRCSAATHRLSPPGAAVVVVGWSSPGAAIESDIPSMMQLMHGKIAVYMTYQWLSNAARVEKLANRLDVVERLGGISPLPPRHECGSSSNSYARRPLARM